MDAIVADMGELEPVRAVTQMESKGFSPDGNGFQQASHHSTS